MSGRVHRVKGWYLYWAMLSLHHQLPLAPTPSPPHTPPLPFCHVVSPAGRVARLS